MPSVMDAISEDFVPVRLKVHHYAVPEELWGAPDDSGPCFDPCGWKLVTDMIKKERERDPEQYAHDWLVQLGTVQKSDNPVSKHVRRMVHHHKLFYSKK